jgi:hypothetical protein
MSTAREIVKLFGGQSALAELIGKGQSTVAYWVKAGVIPAKWQPLLLEKAQEKNIRLRPSDFVIGINNNEQSLATSSLVSKDNEIALGAADIPQDNSHFLFYAANDGAVKVQVLLGDETVWSSQRGMSEIFGVDVRTVNEHLQNIFKGGELDENSVIRKIRTTASDGKSYDINFYNLDAIISVGYRVNSYQATQFRKWATGVLKEYLIKGFTLDDERLKQGNQLFGKDYFDELLDRVREIRASERRFYQKITDIYSQCSIDYDKDAPITHQFYAHVQDKLHYAISGHTSAELIRLRADATKPHMGLSTYKNSKRKGKVTKSDVTVGKNYLSEEELTELNRLVSMYVDFAEGFARRRIAMRMQDWAEKLDGFLTFNAYDVLENYGATKRDSAERIALAEYEKFRVIQDKEYKSDFDKVVDEIRVNKKLPKYKES